jgi:DNA-binding SARP family transcriptional activator
METFWPGSTPEAARNSLNVAVHGLRRALRAVTDFPVVVMERGSYRLHHDLRIWLDVDEFERHVDGGRRLALCQCRACVDALQAELSVEPAPETTRLHERIRAREPCSGLISGGSAEPGGC